jgi:copper transport protein
MLWREVTETRFGHAMGLRLAAAVAAIVLVALVRYVREAWWQAIAASSAGVLSFSIAFAGHAGSGRWTLIGLLLGVVHVLAMMVWVGGLAYLGLVVLDTSRPVPARSVGAAVATDPGRPPEDGNGGDGDDGGDGDERTAVVHRFSALAFTCVVVLVATGVVQGWRIVVRFSDLWSTNYGRLLLSKIILVGLVVAVAGVARRTVHRRWPAAAQLRQLVLCELALAGVILAATAVLVGTAPAADLRAATSAQGVSATLVQDGMLASVVLAPAHQGTGNALHVYVSTPGGSLDAVDGVTARLTLPSRDLGPIPVALDAESVNHFSSYNVTLPYAGAWQLELLVQQANRQTRFATTIPVS